MIRALVWLLVALGGAVPARAQEPDSIGVVADALRRDVAALRRVERELMPAPGAGPRRRAGDALLEGRDRARAVVVQDLDRLVAAGAPGRAAIGRVALEVPEAHLVRRAEIRAAVVASDVDAALGRGDDALRARQASWELAPEAHEGWRALVRAHERAGTLARLRESVARIRILHPESRAVREQEIEGLHRLGRYDEAARVGAATRGDPR